MSKIRDESRPPGYYIKKRLIRNKPAIFGLVFIIFSLIVALLGYLVMPDNTPDANDGAVQIIPDRSHRGIALGERLDFLTADLGTIEQRCQDKSLLIEDFDLPCA